MKATVIEKEVVYKAWGEYAVYHIDYERTDGKIERQRREIQNAGNGAAVILFNILSKKVLLVQQFRLAALLNGHPTGVLVEACAGLVENDDPHFTIKKEIEEELGLHINDVKLLFSAFATPGAKMEKIYFFAAEYERMPTTLFQGLVAEQEDIIVRELDFSEAYLGIESGEIQDSKTIILLQWLRINYPEMMI